MKRLIFCALAGIALCCGARELTLMSYNVKDCNGMDRVNSPSRVATVIKDCKPDIVGLQELDSMTNRSGRRDMPATLGGLTGMQHLFDPAIDFDGGRYGIGMLTAEKPLSTRQVALPGREEARTLLVADYPDFSLACTHLSLTKDDRLAAADTIISLAAKAAVPFFLMGDFNDYPDSELLARLGRAGFTALSDTTARTFPADMPDCTIDYILVRMPHGQATPTVLSRTVVPDSIASDHRPVLVRVALPETAR